MNKPTFTPEAIALACTLIAQAGGDTAKARRAAQAAVAWLCQGDVDPTFKPELAPASTASLVEAQAIAVRLQATIDELRTTRTAIAAQRDKAHAEGELLRSQHIDLQAERKTLTKEVAALNKDKSLLMQDVASLQRRLDARSDFAPEALPLVDDGGEAAEALGPAWPTNCRACNVALPIESNYDDCAACRTPKLVTPLDKQKARIAAVEASLPPAPAPASQAEAFGYPQFDHLPPKMRDWAIARAKSAADAI